MNTQKNTIAIQRLTALWALVESGLGGILHAFKTPFSGLILASIAIIIISLICALADEKWKTMMSSLLVVLIIKAAVSPHSSLTAYMAVSFQAILGGFLFKYITSIPLATILLGVIGVLESALQKLIVLTLLFGNSLWQSIDTFGEWVSDKMGFIMWTSSTNLLIGIYLGIYLIGGFIAGYIANRIILSVRRNWSSPDYRIAIKEENISASQSKTNSRKRRNTFLIATGILMILLVLFSYIQFGYSKGFYILFRTLLIIGLWYVLIGPLVMKWLFAFLRKKESSVSNELQATFDLIPYMRYIILRSWSESRTLNGWERLKSFLRNTLLYSLHFKIE